MSPGSAASRTIKGVAVSALNQILSGAQALILVPFFLRAWGTQDYGRWLALSALTSYLALIDFGGQTYVGNLLAIAYGKGDEAAFRRHLSEAMSLFVLIGAGAFAGIVVLLGISLGPLAATPLGLMPWQALVVALLASNVLFFSVPVGVYVTAYAATGRFARAAMIGNVQRTTGILLSLGLLWLRARPPVFAIGAVLVPALSTAFFWWASRRRISGCHGVRLSWAAAKSGRAHLHGSLQFWLINLSHTIKQEGMVIVLAALGGPASVTLYATHRTIASIPDYTRAFMQPPVTPELSFLWARNRIPELTRAALLIIRAVVLVTGGLALFLWFTAPTLYPLWTRGAIDLHRPVLAILLAQAVLSAGWRTSTWGLLASNNHRKLVGWFVANSVLSLLLGLLLVRPYGVLAILWSGSR